jgi:hypothetical protein
LSAYCVEHPFSHVAGVPDDSRQSELLAHCAAVTAEHCTTHALPATAQPGVLAHVAASSCEHCVEHCPEAERYMHCGLLMHAPVLKSATSLHLVAQYDAFGSHWHRADVAHAGCVWNCPLHFCTHCCRPFDQSHAWNCSWHVAFVTYVAQFCAHVDAA